MGSARLRDQHERKHSLDDWRHDKWRHRHNTREQWRIIHATVLTQTVTSANWSIDDVIAVWRNAVSTLSMRHIITVRAFTRLHCTFYRFELTASTGARFERNKKNTATIHTYIILCCMYRNRSCNLSHTQVQYVPCSASLFPTQREWLAEMRKN